MGSRDVCSMTSPGNRREETAVLENFGTRSWERGEARGNRDGELVGLVELGDTRGMGDGIWTRKRGQRAEIQVGSGAHPSPNAQMCPSPCRHGSSALNADLLCTAATMSLWSSSCSSLGPNLGVYSPPQPHLIVLQLIGALL